MKAIALIAAWTVALALQQAKPPAAERELTFNWPIGIEARVETERSRERSGTINMAPTPAKGVQRMRVLPHPQGRLIRFEITGDLFGGVPNAQLAQLAEQLQSIVPSFVVSGDGRLLQVEGIPRLREAIGTALGATAKKRGPEATATLNKVMQQVLSENVLTQLASREWDLFASSWIGLPLRKDTFEARIEAPSPMFPDTTVPMNVTTTVLGFTPCARGGVARECVEIQSRQSIDQDTMATMMGKFGATIGDKALSSIKYDRLDIVTVLTVRLESDTMLPHDVSFERTSNMAFTEPGGRRAEVKQLDRRTSKFVY